MIDPIPFDDHPLRVETSGYRASVFGARNVVVAQRCFVSRRAALLESRSFPLSANRILDLVGSGREHRVR